MKKRGELGDYEMMPARSEVEQFSEPQKAIWDYFFDGDGSVKPIDRDQIDPVKLKRFLPNIWMADLIKDDKGNLIDCEYRLIGTRLTPVYGERTGEKLISNEEDTSLKKTFPKAFERLNDVLKFVLELKEPVYKKSYYQEKEHEYLNVSGLTFPVYNNSNEINMIFGFVDLRRSSSAYL